MRTFGMRACLLGLAAWGTKASTGDDDWEAILAEGTPPADYTRACPDYKKYSQFAQ